MTFFSGSNSFSKLLQDMAAYLPVMAKYMVSASLYCAYNNLSYANLAIFDPTTYFMFLQLRMLLTGVIYQYLFNRRLTRTQWLSLFLVTVGCMIQKMELPQMSSQTEHPVISKESHQNNQHSGQNRHPLAHFEESKIIHSVGFGVFLILVQVCCSVFAGVFNEKLLKSYDNMHIMVQNVFMYLDSIACNAVVLGFRGDLATAFTTEALSSINVRFLLNTFSLLKILIYFSNP